ncbi:LPXTG cell wall anchor domain-containing protein [Lapidilactobacillus luobeiensis]|uniref:LPXTG cell wall anchor domain-containing protein n=1 Tax=Lapidilactobacillus luobeiensis TaxID=2950371 RepID=UPI0021C39DCB|nr:LPXTG cell wall anchor domain-containing protein [Lapidilactobacillus luobeiensis]
MRKRNFVLLLLMFCLGIIFTTSQIAQADVATSHYDITITATDEQGSKKPSTTTDTDHGGTTSSDQNGGIDWSGIILPQTSEQRQQAMLFWGLLLIILLLIWIGHELNQRRHPERK